MMLDRLLCMRAMSRLVTILIPKFIILFNITIEIWHVSCQIWDT